jgi:Fic-DOC domain mobile mystery protein B
MSDWPSSPGATPIDPSGLEDKSIKTMRELFDAEAKKKPQAHIKYLSGNLPRKKAAFNYEWLLRLHNEMFGRVWSWAGIVRCCDLNIGVPWEQIPGQLGAMLLDLETWSGATSMSLSEIAARLHHRSAWIHPFQNGNGRWARLLTNVWLRLRNNPIVEWPEDTLNAPGAARRKYLDALHRADKGDFTALMELHDYTAGERD